MPTQRPKLKLHRFSRRPPGKAVWLGFAAGVLSRLLRKRLPKPTSEDLSRHDYSTSTQRLGVRFTDRIRDTFRFRWIKRGR